MPFEAPRLRLVKMMWIRLVINILVQSRGAVKQLDKPGLRKKDALDFELVELGDAKASVFAVRVLL